MPLLPCLLLRGLTQPCCVWRQDEGEVDHSSLGYTPLLCESDSDEDAAGKGAAAAEAEVDHAAAMLRALEADYRACLAAGRQGDARVAPSAPQVPPPWERQHADTLQPMMPSDGMEGAPRGPTAAAAVMAAPADGSKEPDLPSPAPEAALNSPTNRAATERTNSWVGATAPAAQIQQAMAGITLPKSVWPAWAEGQTDAELLAKLTGPPRPT